MKRHHKIPIRDLPDDALIFGGSQLARGTSPKVARPLEPTLPIHLVLNAERSAMRLPKHFARVNDIVHGVAAKRRVRIYQYANVGNHLHVLLKLPDRAAWAAFIREVSGRIARLTGVGWTSRPFTRIVRNWKSAYRTAESYVALNHFEAERRLGKTAAAGLRELRTQLKIR